MSDPICKCGQHKSAHSLTPWGQLCPSAVFRARTEPVGDTVTLEVGEKAPSIHNIKLPDKTCWRCKQPVLTGNFYAVCFQCAIPTSANAVITEFLSGEPAALRARNEQLEVQLAACGTAALGYCLDLAPSAWGWSAAYRDVVKLRAENARLQRQVNAARGLTAKKAWEHYKASTASHFAEDFIALLHATLDAAAQEPEEKGNA